MPDTAPFEPGTAPSSAHGGAWELELWSGSVRFSEWFYRRLPWAGQDGECVQLDGGRIEWWGVRGAAERNSGGQPVHLAGCIDDVSDGR